ncbi:MAG: hypothetical protein A2V66_14910 [Ignavibacteria bacterium RBG_13_36_8]|nr:MAG: hypothetical protein A2V66_14910 [Ignavibacteria bacterium RBG_13_36_8]
MQRSLFYLAAIVAIFLIAKTVSGQTSIKIGIRGGVGTDINLGIAYGLNGNILIDFPQNPLELGVIFFGGSFKESTDEGMHTYDEKTNVIVIGLLANYLIGYTPREPGLFFVTGLGLASINVEWEEKSTTDMSLGTPLPGGGTMQSDDGTAGGMVFNLGIGGSFSSGLDIRVELPVIVTFAPPGGASSVVPTLIATLGYRF